MIHYEPQDFIHYDKLEPSIIDSLEQLSNALGRKATVLSDWRPYDPENPNSRHNFGDAVDVVFPSIDPLEVWRVAQDYFPDGGAGVYLNERGATSFHFDTRGERARWGALITPGVNPDTGQAFRHYEYIAATPVLERIRQGLNSLSELSIAVGEEVVTATKAVVEGAGELSAEAVETVKKKPLQVILTLGAIYVGVMLLTKH